MRSMYKRSQKEKKTFVILFAYLIGQLFPTRQPYPMVHGHNLSQIIS